MPFISETIFTRTPRMPNETQFYKTNKNSDAAFDIERAKVLIALVKEERGEFLTLRDIKKGSNQSICAEIDSAHHDLKSILFALSSLESRENGDSGVMPSFIEIKIGDGKVLYKPGDGVFTPYQAAAASSKIFDLGRREAIRAQINTLNYLNECAPDLIKSEEHQLLLGSLLCQIEEFKEENNSNNIDLTVMVNKAVDAWATKMNYKRDEATASIRIDFNAMAGGYVSRSEYIQEQLLYHNWNDPQFDKNDFVKGLTKSDLCQIGASRKLSPEEKKLIETPFGDELSDVEKLGLCNEIANLNLKEYKAPPRNLAPFEYSVLGCIKNYLIAFFKMESVNSYLKNRIATDWSTFSQGEKEEFVSCFSGRDMARLIGIDPSSPVPNMPLDEKLFLIDALAQQSLAEQSGDEIFDFIDHAKQFYRPSTAGADKKWAIKEKSQLIGELQLSDEEESALELIATNSGDVLMGYSAQGGFRMPHPLVETFLRGHFDATATQGQRDGTAKKINRYDESLVRYTRYISEKVFFDSVIMSIFLTQAKPNGTHQPVLSSLNSALSLPGLKNKLKSDGSSVRSEVLSITAKSTRFYPVKSFSDEAAHNPDGEGRKDVASPSETGEPSADQPSEEGAKRSSSQETLYHTKSGHNEGGATRISGENRETIES